MVGDLNYGDFGARDEAEMRLNWAERSDHARQSLVTPENSKNSKAGKGAVIAAGRVFITYSYGYEWMSVRRDLTVCTAISCS